MKHFSVPLLAIGLALNAWCDKKVVSPTTSASNEQIDVLATIIMDPADVKQKLGADPGAGIVLLDVRVTPKTDQSVQVSPDDFILLAHDDGERSKPFGPEELAGSGAMVVRRAAPGDSRSKGKGKGVKPSVGLGPIMAGTGGSPGNTAPTEVSTQMDDKRKGDAALLEALKAKQFPTKDTTDEVSGLLYFPLDGKHKLKNLAVLYRGPSGKLNLEFVH